MKKSFNFKFPEAGAEIDISIVKGAMIYYEQRTYAYPDIYPYRYSHYVDGDKHVIPIGHNSSAFYITFNYSINCKPVAIKIISETINIFSEEIETPDKYADFHQSPSSRQNYVVVPGQGPIYSGYHSLRPRQLVVNGSFTTSNFQRFPLGMLEFIVMPLVFDPPHKLSEFKSQEPKLPFGKAMLGPAWHNGQMHWQELPPPTDFILQYTSPTFVRAPQSRRERPKYKHRYHDRSRCGIFLGALVPAQSFFSCIHYKFDRAKAQYVQVDFINEKQEDVASRMIMSPGLYTPSSYLAAGRLLSDYLHYLKCKKQYLDDFKLEIANQSLLYWMLSYPLTASPEQRAEQKANELRFPLSPASVVSNTFFARIPTLPVEQKTEEEEKDDEDMNRFNEFTSRRRRQLGEYN
jgi:hypothetical protein